MKMSPNPYKFDVAYQLTPRLASQISVSHGGRTVDQIGTGTTSAGLPTTRSWYSKSQSVGVPVTLRYTLTRTAAHRLQADAILGLVLVRGHYMSERIEKEDGQIISEFRSEQRITGEYLTGGLGLHYALGASRHIELTADVMANKALENYSSDFYTFLNAPLGVTRSYSLGVRYRFKKSDF